jgi:tetratricopeptide (TPR) repeat protein
MRQETLDSILQEIRLAEFEREARAYRRRAERAYLNGWYEESLGDFLVAEKRNYPDFAVLRSIASIYLYHLIDLPKALEYFRKAAKYSLPSDARQSAEANFFAGMVCVIERNLEESALHLGEASNLNPGFGEAHYQQAWVAAMLGDCEAATTHLEAAINGDPRYHERAKNDRGFDGMRAQVTELLDGMMQPVREKLAEARLGLKPKKGRFTAKGEEERLSKLLGDMEIRMAETGTYKGGLEFINALNRFQNELRDLYDLFRKRYEIYINDYVRSVTFSPDGQSLAAGFLNGSIKLWEVYSGNLEVCLDGHLASVNSVAFSPNARWLASGSRDRTIKVWDTESGGMIQNMRGHSGEVRAIAFSPDGSWLISGGHDRTVRIWRVETGRQVQILGEHKHFVTSVVFSPTGRYFASGSLDRTIKLWDVSSGRPFRVLAGHTKGIESLAFSADGALLASGGNDRCIKIWDVNGNLLHSLTGLSNDINSLSFSPDGKLLAAGSLGKMVKVWRIDGGEVVETVRFPQISYNSVAFSPEGQWLALASRDIQLWLKVMLTEESYAEVAAGEARSRQTQDDERRAFREAFL